MWNELKKTLRPLALSGLFFGLGAASKWTCFYAGGGLALLFFGSLIARFIDRRRALTNGTARERDLVATFWKNTCLTLLWCCLWFLLVPGLIYFGSYLPYYIYEAGQTQGYGLRDAFRYLLALPELHVLVSQRVDGYTPVSVVLVGMAR